MTIKEQAQFLLNGIQPWAESQTVAGTVKIANDKPHLFKILGAAPGAARTVIYFVNEMPRSRFSDKNGKVDRKFWLVISRGQGFNVERGSSLTEGVAGGAPMFDLVEGLRETVRALRLDDQTTDDYIPDYKGADNLNLEGATVDAYYLEFLLAADIPQHS